MRDPFTASAKIPPAFHVQCLSLIHILHMDRDSAPWISDLQEAMERNPGIGCPGAECGNLYSFSGKRSSALCVSVDGVYASCDILGTGLCREGYRRKKNRRKMKSLNFFYGKYIVR